MNRTLWWHILVTIAMFNALWGLASVLLDVTDTLGPTTRWILLGGTLLIIPLFYYPLYQELLIVQDSESPWDPDPRLWVGGGVCFSILGCLGFLNPATHYVAGLYLLQRYRKFGILSIATGFD